jgi:hypothetical protein
MRHGEVRHAITEENKMARLVDEAEGLSKIEFLQQHENSVVFDKAVKITETYFSQEDDDGGVLLISETRPQVPPPHLRDPYYASPDQLLALPCAEEPVAGGGGCARAEAASAPRL